MAAGGATPDDFWDFTLDFYGRPGVSPACLDLQDGAGADVNIVIFCLWLARLGRRLSAEEVARIEATARPWREEGVKPLRTLRRRMKGGFAPIAPAAAESFRDALKTLELRAEELQHRTLAERLPPASIGSPAPPAEAARANLSAYAALLGGMPAESVETLLAAL